jgi:hypothetical protein
MNKREEALAAVAEAFREAPRPQEFIWGTCCCEECREHNQTLADHTPATITLQELGNPGWDPMCFANEEAFLYYLPAMMRLMFEDPYYIDQVLFHLNCSTRPGPITGPQAEAVVKALWTFREVESKKLGEFLDEDFWEQAVGKLEKIMASPRESGGTEGEGQEGGGEENLR